MKKLIPNDILNFIKDLWPMFLLFIIVVCSIRIIDIIMNKKKIVLYQELVNLVFIIYLLLLFQLVTSTDFESYSNNFIPFKEIMRYNIDSSLFYKNVIGNIILLVPFGYFVSFYLNNLKWYIALILTLITSISTEIIQMYIGRSFDIDDILLNLLGGLIGYLIYKLQYKFINILPEKIRKNWLADIIAVIVFVIIVSIIYAILWR